MKLLELLTKLVAKLVKRTYRPSELITAPSESSLPLPVPAPSTLTREVGDTNCPKSIVRDAQIRNTESGRTILNVKRNCLTKRIGSYYLILQLFLLRWREGVHLCNRVIFRAPTSVDALLLLRLHTSPNLCRYSMESMKAWTICAAL